MEATARFPLDRRYFEVAYDDLLVANRLWRRWQKHLGAGVLLMGLGFAAAGTYWGFIACLSVGVLEIVGAILHRRRWIEARLVQKTAGREVRVSFGDQEVRLDGPFSEARCSWDGFSRCVAAPRGLILSPANGIAIYIPDAALTPVSAKGEIIARITRMNQPS